MTISARRAALLGLTVPLSAIMLAVLGLWPESDGAGAAGSAAVPGEHQAAIQPKRRVRRWGSLAGIPTPWEILQSQEREEEDLLLELGALV